MITTFTPTVSSTAQFCAVRLRRKYKGSHSNIAINTKLFHDNILTSIKAQKHHSAVHQQVWCCHRLLAPPYAFRLCKGHPRGTKHWLTYSWEHSLRRALHLPHGFRLCPLCNKHEMQLSSICGLTVYCPHLHTPTGIKHPLESPHFSQRLSPIFYGRTLDIMVTSSR